jgi:hypothetical protein
MATTATVCLNAPTSTQSQLVTNKNEECETTADENEEHETNASKATPIQSKLRDKRKNLRNISRRADYTYCFSFTQIAQSLTNPAASLEPHTIDEVGSLPAILYGLLFTQMTAQKGIKKHGLAAMDALRKEFEQFRVMDVTEEQKAESLCTLSAIKENVTAG